jgi:hypothetical protein
MLMLRLLRRAALALGLVALVLPSAASGQLRDIVTKNVAASSSASELELRFDDDSRLAISFEGGTVFIDGETVGDYESGDPLDEAFRQLLGQAMALENGALAEALVDWSVPSTLEDVLVARRIDEALERSIQEVDVQVDVRDGDVSISIGDESSLAQLLIGSVTRLGVLDDALEGLDEEFRIHINEDVTIEAGEIERRNVVVIEGTLRVEGEVRGNVVVVGGALDVPDDGEIRGEARIADSRILGNSGEVRGGIVDVLKTERDLEVDLRDRMREEIREEVRSDLWNEFLSAARFEDDGFSIMAVFRPVIRGVSGIMEKLLIVFVLGLLGAGFFAVAGDNVDAIAETARRAPGRAAMVGLAGSFLLIPVWLLGTVALAISIIGIPVAVAWVPLFPIAAAMAAVLGYIAVARNAGEWLADSTWPWTGWIRKSNPIFTLFGGLLGLMFAFLAGHLMSIVPVLGMFSWVLFVTGSLLMFYAMQIGFGAVLLTRVGRRREYYPSDVDAAWEDAMRVDVDVDDSGAEAAPNA